MTALPRNGFTSISKEPMKIAAKIRGNLIKNRMSDRLYHWNVGIIAFPKLSPIQNQVDTDPGSFVSAGVVVIPAGRSRDVTAR